MSNPILRLPANQAGRDFIMGDLHGEFATLQRAIEGIGFDPEKDRLFSVGDLIDRGPDSAKCLRMACEPWFFVVAGNHEEFLINDFSDTREHWYSNGGRWWERETDKDGLWDIAAALPWMIVVGEGPTRFNITHAEWLETDAEIDNYETFAAAIKNPDYLWFRDLIRTGIDATRPGLSPTFVGHTYCGLKPFQIESHWFLDTGISMPDVEHILSIVEITQGSNTVATVHQFDKVAT